MSSVGILFGALASGPLGDRFGRKPLLILSVGIIGLFSALSAFAWSVPSITLMRFLTGLGIGGAMPVTVALTSDYSPINRRGTLIMLMFCGNTLGGFLGGQLVAQILPIFGWQSIFFSGGIPPLLLIPFLMLFLPESPRFLIAHRADARDHQANPEPAQCQRASRGLEAGRRRQRQSGAAIVHRRAGGRHHAVVGRLLRQSPQLVSVQLLDADGAHPVRPEAGDRGVLRQHVLARRHSQTLLLGPLIDRFGAPRVLACSFASGVVFMLMIGLYNLPAPWIMLPILGAGAAMIGSQLGANAMAAGLYPARIRSTGVGWALGVGRLGGIAGPALGGFLLGLGLPPKQIFLCACGPALIAAMATILLTAKAARNGSVAVTATRAA